MNDLNYVLISGRLISNPVVKEVNNTNVCKFVIAINKNIKKQDNTIERTVFVDVDVWGKNALACGNYLNKGREVRIIGSINQSSWLSSDGEKKSHFFITADKIEFGKGKQNFSNNNETNEIIDDVVTLTDLDEESGVPF